MKFAIVAAIAALFAGEANAQDPRCSPFPRRSGMLKEAHCQIEKPLGGGLTGFGFLGGEGSGEVYGGIQFQRSASRADAPTLAGAAWWGLDAGTNYQISLRGSSSSIGQAQTASSEGFIGLPVEVTTAVSIPDDIGKEACVYSAAGSSVACCTITAGTPDPPLIEMNQDDADFNPVLSSS